MHYYNFNIKDWLSGTSHLTPEEEGIYLRLINYYYDNEQIIPLETQPVIRRLRLVNYEETVQNILEEFFNKTEQGWENKKCEMLVKSYQSKAKANKVNGKKGGRPRKLRPSSPNPEQTHKKPTGLNLGSSSVSESKPKQKATNNHKPLTNNHKTNKKTGRFQRPTREELIQEFGNRVLDPNAEVDKFLNHYESNGWKVGKNPMASWKHAVGGWISRANNNISSIHPQRSKQNAKSVLEGITDRTWADELQYTPSPTNHLEQSEAMPL